MPKKTLLPKPYDPLDAAAGGIIPPPKKSDLLRAAAVAIVQRQQKQAAERVKEREELRKEIEREAAELFPLPKGAVGSLGPSWDLHTGQSTTAFIVQIPLPPALVKKHEKLNTMPMVGVQTVEAVVTELRAKAAERGHVVKALLADEAVKAKLLKLADSLLNSGDAIEA